MSNKDFFTYSYCYYYYYFHVEFYRPSRIFILLKRCPMCDKTGYWKRRVGEPVRSASRKESQNYKDKSDYDFSKANKNVIFFSADSQIVMNMVILLILNIKSLVLKFIYCYLSYVT